MSGNSDLILLQAEPISAANLLASLTSTASGSAGAIATFLGITRGEKNAGGQKLLALDYEAYTEMAIAQMLALGAAAHSRWSIRRLMIVHRTGRVAVGEPSVFIAVATPHRGESFAACQFLIDTLKQQTAIWKKEIWSDGSQTWVDANPIAEQPAPEKP